MRTHHPWGFGVLLQDGDLCSCQAAPSLHPDRCVFICGAVRALHGGTGDRTGHGGRTEQASWPTANHRLKEREKKSNIKLYSAFTFCGLKGACLINAVCCFAPVCEIKHAAQVSLLCSYNSSQIYSTTELLFGSGQTYRVFSCTVRHQWSSEQAGHSHRHPRVVL